MPGTKPSKYYAVALRSGEKSVLRSWDEARARVATDPKGAVHKSFPDETSALAFLASVNPDAETETHADTPVNDRPTCPPGGCVAFVDGSYNPETKEWGYGVHLYDPHDPDGTPTELSGRGVEGASARNVAGEIHAAERAVRTAVRKGFASIDVYYDYKGVEAWVTGEWSANAPLTAGYRDRMRALSDVIHVNFHKVKGHSGLALNDRADVLAKRGCGVA